MLLLREVKNSMPTAQDVWGKLPQALCISLTRSSFRGMDQGQNELCSALFFRMQYPGQIKVTVIRETRAVDFAK